MSRWVPLGPSCVPNTIAGDDDSDDTAAGRARRRNTVAGRMRVIAVDPRAAASTVFAGTDFSGLWRTFDGGQTWGPTADVDTAIVGVAVTPSGRLWVAGTSDQRQWRLSRSDDRGDSFSRSPSFDGEITALLPDPRDDDLVFIGAQRAGEQTPALFHGPHSAPGTDVFVKLRDGRCTSLGAELNATTGKLRLYAAFDTDWIFAGDPDVGLTALPRPPGVNDIIRTKLAVAASDPRVVYVAVGTSKDTQVLQGIFRSSNRGDAWSAVGPLAPGTSVPMGHQIHHNLTLAVHPRDPDVLMLGEVHLWRSADGGRTFDNVGNHVPPIHVDQMALAFAPSDEGAVSGGGSPGRPGDRGILWASNDGGVYLSRDGGRSFQHRNRGLQTTMFYHLTHHPVVPAVILGGTQDNGGLRFTGHPAWQETLGGDVTHTAIDPFLPPPPTSPGDPPFDLARYRTWYAAIFAQLWRSRFSGESTGSPLLPGDTATWDVVAGDREGGAHTPILFDRLVPRVVYWGKDELYQIVDDPDLGFDEVGRPIEAPNTIIFTPTTKPITALAMSRDGGVMYVGTDNGEVVSRLVRTGDKWSDQTRASPPGAVRLPGGSITAIVVDPTDSERLIISYDTLSFSRALQKGSMLWRSANGGADWLPIDLDTAIAVPDGRPMSRNVCRSLAMDPIAPHALYVAFDSGVFRFDETVTVGSPWSTWWKGLPSVSVRHIAIHERGRLLRAATHGRGVWERPLAAADTDAESPGPTANVFLRAHRYDDGRRPPLNASGEDPIDKRRRYSLLDGVDIKLDIDPVLSGSFQKPSSTVDYTPSGPIDHIGFQALDNRTPRRSREARVYVQVQNAGPDIAANVKLRAFWSTHGAHGLAALTPALWAAFAADNDPTDGDWHAVAAPKVISDLRPAEPQVAVFSWDVPGGPDRVALMAIVGTPAARAEPVGAPDDLLRAHQHISLKDVALDEPLYAIVGLVLLGVGLAAGITYALVKEPA